MAVSLWGRFNPVILQPEWLYSQGLIDEADRRFAVADDADRVIVSREFTAAQFPWLRVEVTRETCRLISEPAAETPERVRDVAIGIFQLLTHTPVERLNIDYSWHIKMPTAPWDALVTALAPATALDGLLKNAAFRSLEYSSDEDDSEVDLVVQPSYNEGFTGYVLVATGREVEEGPESASNALAMLDQRWDETRTNAERILDTLLTR